MKNRIYILCTILAFSLIFSSCAQPANSEVKTDGGQNTGAAQGTSDTTQKTELTLAIGGEPDEGFDPCTGWGRYGSPLFQSTLMDVDKDFNYVNDLATEHKVSEDGLTWTFKIREDAKFTDGEPVKASDVAFTFNTAKTSSSEIDLTKLESARAVDATTVEFKLVSPMSVFLDVTADLGIVPEHAYSSTYSQNPIGSGPYKFVQWDKGQQLIIERNEDYYGKKPAFEKIVMLYIGEDAALAAVKAGTVDVAMTVPSMVQDIPGYKLLNCKSVDNRGVSMPVTAPGTKSADGIPVGNAVTSDIAIRKALCYGIERKTMVDDVLKGYGTEAYSVCDGLPWWNSETAIKDGELEAQKAALDVAGWKVNNDGIREKDGIKASITLLYPSSDSVRQAIALSFSQQARELGIEVTVKGASWDDIGKQMYSDCVLFGWGSQSPMEVYNLYYGKEVTTGYNNPTNAVNPKVDEYIDAAMNALTVEDANANWQKAQWDGSTGFSMQGDASWCWLVNIDHLYYVRDGINTGEQQIHPHGHGYPLISNIKDWYMEK